MYTSNFFCRSYLQSVYSHASCDPCAGIQVCAARGRAMHRKRQPALRASARQLAPSWCRALRASEGAVCYHHSEQPLGHGQVIQVRVVQQDSHALTRYCTVTCQYLPGSGAVSADQLSSDMKQGSNTRILTMFAVLLVSICNSLESSCVSAMSVAARVATRACARSLCNCVSSATWYRESA